MRHSFAFFVVRRIQTPQPRQRDLRRRAPALAAAADDSVAREIARRLYPLQQPALGVFSVAANKMAAALAGGHGGESIGGREKNFLPSPSRRRWTFRAVATRNPLLSEAYRARI
jgi:hypothetical protein